MDSQTSALLSRVADLEHQLFVRDSCLLLAVLLIGILMCVAVTPRAVAAPSPAKEKPVTIVETDATREECVKKLRTMFAFFPATQSMMVHFDNSTYREPDSLLFLVFEVNPIFSSWSIDTKGPVSKTDSFAGISNEKGPWSKASRGGSDFNAVAHPDFFMIERKACVDASWTKKYVVMSLVRDFTGEDIVQELRRMAAESAGMM